MIDQQAVEVIQSASAPGTTYPGMVWIDTDADGGAVGTLIADADGDTKVNTEEGADEDIIRFDCGGKQVAYLEDCELHLVKDLNNSFTQFTFEDSDGELYRWTAYGSSHATYPGHLYLEERNLGSGNIFGIYPTGEVTKPLQPAFSAYLSANQSNLAVGENVTILFDTESWDQGGDFNVATYTFTAPVTGKYQFNLTITLEQIDTAATAILVTIVTSNRSYIRIFSPDKFTGDVTYWSLAINQLCDMDANDTAYIQYWQTAGAAQVDVIANLWYTQFTGALIC